MIRAKSLWSFGFLSWLSAHVFITNCGFNGCVYILEIVLDILDKLIHDSWNVYWRLTVNEVGIKLAPLIIFSVNNNLTNTSSTPPPEVEKTVLYIVHSIILCTSTFFVPQTSIYWKLRIKSLTCFKYQINITVVLLSCGIFFKH